MSNYTTSIKRPISTWLDEHGIYLSHPRYENETLFEYKNRLIDITKNPSNSTLAGLNNSFGRALKTQKIHALTLDTTSTEPGIEITSKYLRLKNGDDIDLQIDLSNSLESIYNTINTSSSYFSVTYYNDEISDKKGTKLLYSDNIKSANEVISEYGYKLLLHKYIKSYLINSNKHLRLVDSIDNIEDIKDFYINKELGAVYFKTNGIGTISYSYYEIPFKLYYSPVNFYPLSDEDAKENMYDLKYDTEEYSILNSTGSRIINSILKESPITWGI